MPESSRIDGQNAVSLTTNVSLTQTGIVTTLSPSWTEVIATSDLKEACESLANKKMPKRVRQGQLFELKVDTDKRFHEWNKDFINPFLSHEALAINHSSAPYYRSQLLNNPLLKSLAGDKYLSFIETTTNFYNGRVSNLERSRGYQEIPVGLIIFILALMIPYNKSLRAYFNSLPPSTQLPKLVVEQILCIRESRMHNCAVSFTQKAIPDDILESLGWKKSVLDKNYLSTAEGQNELLVMISQLQLFLEDFPFEDKPANDNTFSGNTTSQCALSVQTVAKAPKTNIEVRLAKKELADNYPEEFAKWKALDENKEKPDSSFDVEKGVQTISVAIDQDLDFIKTMCHPGHSYANQAINNVHAGHITITRQRMLYKDTGKPVDLTMFGHEINVIRTESSIPLFIHNRSNGSVHNDNTWNRSEQSYSSSGSERRSGRGNRNSRRETIRNPQTTAEFREAIKQKDELIKRKTNENKKLRREIKALKSPDQISTDTENNNNNKDNENKISEKPT